MKSSCVFVRGADFCCHAFLMWNNSKEVAVMEDYKSMYFKLFNQLTDVIEQLKEIQSKAEEMYINSYDDDK